MKYLFTSESVTEGHPDKLCDYISDSVLDECLKQDRNSRVACETLASKGEIYITGEISSKANINIEQIARNAIKEIGYNNASLDIDYKTCKITVNTSKQSSDIAMGVDKSLEDKEGENVSSEGAGDQGIMFGFACDETDEFMPLPINLAHKLAKKLSEVRKSKEIRGLRPDGKVQVTVEYDDGKPLRVDTVVLSTQHIDGKDIEELRKEVKEKIIFKVIPKNLIDDNTKYYINPTGRFVIGGPLGDSGLTGRKIIVDTYGGYARHGGGAFSGKDATKVDRSVSYMLRHIAKNVVANGLARRCEIQLSYGIGIKEPLSIYIECFGSNRVPEWLIIKLIKEKFDLIPNGIIDYLKLKEPIFSKTSNYGHFGREGFTWEKIIQM